MPCNDITERIEVVIDDGDRMLEYTLRKRVCGRPVGSEALLASTFRGKTLAEIAALTPDGLLDEIRAVDDTEVFLALKHLFAVQAACEVLLGEAPCGPGAACAAAEIVHTAGRTQLAGMIRVDAVHAEIRSCGRCCGCPAEFNETGG